MKKSFILGIATGLTIAGASLVFANSQIQAFLNDQIKVTLNGQVQEFKDETTNETQYPITYKNRTYLPLRTVANLVGVNVDYDANNNTAMLESEKSTDDMLLDTFSSLDFTNSLEDNGYSITSDGKTITTEYGESVLTNLNSNIKSFKVVLAQVENFIVLTDDNKVYYAGNDGQFEQFTEVYNNCEGVSGFSTPTMDSDPIFVIKEKSEIGIKYTIFTNLEQKFSFDYDIYK